MAKKITVKWGIRIPLTNFEGRNSIEDSIKIQKIVFAAGGKWRGFKNPTEVATHDVEEGSQKPYSALFIDREGDTLLLSGVVNGEHVDGYKTISAKFFIETNGVCSRKKN